MALSCIIVDDNVGFLDAARDLLERQGVRVVGVASTSAEALVRVDETRPEVVLVDIDLGPESGFDVARLFADRPDPVPVLLISTYAERDLAELIQASPAVGFLSKREISKRAIDELLGRA